MSSGLPKPCPLTPEFLFRIQSPFLVLPRHAFHQENLLLLWCLSAQEASDSPRLCWSCGRLFPLLPPSLRRPLNNVVNGPILGTDMTMDVAGERDSFTVPLSSAPFDDLSAFSPAAAADVINASPDEATTGELAVDDEDLDIPSEDLSAKGALYHALQPPPLILNATPAFPLLISLIPQTT